MKKILGLLMYGLAVFGVAAGAGLLLKPKAHSAGEHAEGEHAESGHAEGDGHAKAEPGGHGTPAASHASAETKPADSHAPAASHGAPDEHKTADAGDDGHGKDDKDAFRPKRDPNELPNVVRPAPMTVEEIVRYGLGLKARDEVVRAREASLQRLETQQRMVMTDIRGERREIESILAQAREQRLATEEILNRVAVRQQKMEVEQKQLIALKEKELEEQHQKLLSQKEKELLEKHSSTLTEKQKELDVEKQQAAEKLQALESEKNSTLERLKALQNPVAAEAAAGANPGGIAAPSDSTSGDDPETKANRAARVKELALLIEGVTPEVASSMMKEMANDGQMDMVVQLIAGMEPRKATQVLEAVTSKDPKLGVELLNQYSNLPPKPSKTASKPKKN